MPARPIAVTSSWQVGAGDPTLTSGQPCRRSRSGCISAGSVRNITGRDHRRRDHLRRHALRPPVEDVLLRHRVGTALGADGQPQHGPRTGTCSRTPPCPPRASCRQALICAGDHGRRRRRDRQGAVRRDGAQARCTFETPLDDPADDGSLLGQLHGRDGVEGGRRARRRQGQHVRGLCPSNPVACSRRPIGDDAKNLHLVDGSGLSAANRLTASALAELLARTSARTRRWGPRYARHPCDRGRQRHVARPSLGRFGPRPGQDRHARRRLVALRLRHDARAEPASPSRS